MAKKELKIRDFCGDYALDIPNFNGETITLFFNSRRNAENVKRIIEVDGSVPNHATVCDMQEVRHGKNITTMNPVDEFECSECGFICEISEKIYDDEYTFDCYREYNPKFCPQCGAKMDKE